MWWPFKQPSPLPPDDSDFASFENEPMPDPGLLVADAVKVKNQAEAEIAAVINGVQMDTGMKVRELALLHMPGSPAPHVVLKLEL